MADLTIKNIIKHARRKFKNKEKIEIDNIKNTERLNQYKNELKLNRKWNKCRER